MYRVILSSTRTSENRSKKKEEKEKTKTKRQHCTRLSVPAALVVVLRHERGDIYCRPYRESWELLQIYIWRGSKGWFWLSKGKEAASFVFYFFFLQQQQQKQEKKKKDDWNRDMRCSPLSVNKDNNRQAAEDVHITLFIGCWRGQYARKVERPSLTALISLVSLSHSISTSAFRSV